MGVHSVGRGLHQVQLPHLLPHIARDELDGRLHFGHDPLGFLDAIHARLAEAYVLGNGADRVDVVLDISSIELPVASHAAPQIHKVIGVADGTEALGDHLALPRDAGTLDARLPYPAQPAPGALSPWGDTLGHALQVCC